jgi:hypothetical protein
VLAGEQEGLETREVGLVKSYCHKADGCRLDPRLWNRKSLPLIPLGLSLLLLLLYGSLLLRRGNIGQPQPSVCHVG